MLISSEYAELNRKHHEESDAFGSGGALFVGLVRELANILQTENILDYGCGKGELQKSLGFPIQEYDPCVPEKSQAPVPAKIVVCASVLEHVEPQHLDNVLADLRRCTTRMALIIVPHNPAVDTLPDGSNAHRTIEDRDWWIARLKEYFTICHWKTFGALTCADGHNMMIGSRTAFICK